jgi:hypothetical protein
MKTSAEIAEELFGEAGLQGWHARAGHALSDDKFTEVVQALDAARADGRALQREDEVHWRRHYIERLDALLGIINPAKKVLNDEIQTAPSPRHR